MILHYRLFGMRCGSCDRPVDRIDVYADAVVTVHQQGYGPPCVHRTKPRAGDVGEETPRRPASPVRSMRDAA